MHKNEPVFRFANLLVHFCDSYGVPQSVACDIFRFLAPALVDCLSVAPPPELLFTEPAKDDNYGIVDAVYPPGGPINVAPSRSQALMVVHALVNIVAYSEHKVIAQILPSILTELVSAARAQDPSASQIHMMLFYNMFDTLYSDMIEHYNKTLDRATGNAPTPAPALAPACAAPAVAPLPAGHVPALLLRFETDVGVFEAPVAIKNGQQPRCEDAGLVEIPAHVWAELQRRNLVRPCTTPLPAPAAAPAPQMPEIDDISVYYMFDSGYDTFATSVSSLSAVARLLRTSVKVATTAATKTDDTAAAATAAVAQGMLARYELELGGAALPADVPESDVDRVRTLAIACMLQSEAPAQRRALGRGLEQGSPAGELGCVLSGLVDQMLDESDNLYPQYHGALQPTLCRVLSGMPRQLWFSMIHQMIDEEERAEEQKKAAEELAAAVEVREDAETQSEPQEQEQEDTDAADAVEVEVEVEDENFGDEYEEDGDDDQYDENEYEDSSSAENAEQPKEAGTAHQCTMPKHYQSLFNTMMAQLYQETPPPNATPVSRPAPAPAPADPPAAAPVVASVVAEVRLVAGCPHYLARYQVVCPECECVHGCRLCHNNAIDDHVVERGDVREVICTGCGDRQPLAPVCRTCNTEFGRSYCATCTLCDDLSTKTVYHCSGCRVCRCGDPSHYEHCNSCNLCWRRDAKHTCHGMGDDTCPVCYQSISSTTNLAATMLPCGHFMHQACIPGHSCPLCRRLIYEGKQREWWEVEMEKIRKRMIVPSEKPVSRLCLECNTVFQDKFHFYNIYVCPECGTHNTDSA